MHRKTFFAAAAIFAIVPAALSAAPAGWIAAKSHEGKCQTFVPAGWKPGVAGIGMQSSDSKSTVLVSNQDSSVAATKAAMPSMFKVTKTYDDSASRYWIEYKEAGSKRHWYIVTPAASGICTAVFDFDSSLSEADAKTVATSLGKY